MRNGVSSILRDRSRILSQGFLGQASLPCVRAEEASSGDSQHWFSPLQCQPKYILSMTGAKEWWFFFFSSLSNHVPSFGKELSGHFPRYSCYLMGSYSFQKWHFSFCHLGKIIEVPRSSASSRDKREDNYSHGLKCGRQKNATFPPKCPQPCEFAVTCYKGKELRLQVESVLLIIDLELGILPWALWVNWHDHKGL
jgi:hypothetical protein